MADEQIHKELTRLGRKVRNTRLGMVLGFGLMGVGAYYGVRYVGEQHHQVFSEMYRYHKRPMDTRSPFERVSQIKFGPVLE